MEEKKQQPFFAKFLESQHKNVPQPQEDANSEQLESSITKPWLDHHDETHKYPSDGDEGGV
ncbi:microviridin/marinostatin family tricyclic proteinase inhibitor [Nostoc ellipsosporum NOK]|jgi:hypothetical protein|nr:microviridin/marinostatin family tricyclic proteinase inhibitor [Nostoc ellipsosporum NOK]